MCKCTTIPELCVQFCMNPAEYLHMRRSQTKSPGPRIYLHRSTEGGFVREMGRHFSHDESDGGRGKGMLQICIIINNYLHTYFS